MREARYTKSDSGPEQLDEVVADDVANFHLEQLDKGVWWVGLSHHDGSVTHITLSSRSKRAAIDGLCEFDV